MFSIAEIQYQKSCGAMLTCSRCIWVLERFDHRQNDDADQKDYWYFIKYAKIAVRFFVPVLGKSFHVG